MKSQIRKQYLSLPTDEQMNVITHGFGLLLCLIFTPVLLTSEPFSVQFMGLCLFVFGVAFMFFSSTIYHFSNIDIRKNRWRIVDHISIFILIGATYTPFVLYYFNEPTGYKFLLTHWLIILGGIIFKLIFKDKYEIFSVSLYLVLGWMVIFIFETITSGMSDLVKFWLLAGGCSYTVGVIFYAWTKLVWHHAIWHIFVILGCAGHFIALLIS